MGRTAHARRECWGLLFPWPRRPGTRRGRVARHAVAEGHPSATAWRAAFVADEGRNDARIRLARMHGLPRAQPPHAERDAPRGPARTEESLPPPTPAPSPP